MHRDRIPIIVAEIYLAHVYAPCWAEVIDRVRDVKVSDLCCARVNIVLAPKNALRP